MNNICPICNNPLLFSERYPRALCNDCIGQAIDSKGNKVIYRNGMNGFGFESHHFSIRTNKVKYIKQDPVCFIGGKECIAEESRFGGIVVQLK